MSHVTRGGFTLMEMLIGISILILLLSVGLWVSMDVFRHYSYSTERNIFVSALQKARHEAIVNLYEMPHGVHVEAGQYVIFSGASYGTNPAYDRVIDPPAQIVLGGGLLPATPLDIVFAQVSGKPDFTGTVTISDGAKSTDIVINSEGGISW